MKYCAIITNGVIKNNIAFTQEAPEIAIPKAAKMGFDAIQLTIGSKDDYDIPKIKELVKENGLFVNALATGRIYVVDHLSMGSGDEENRKACVERLCELTDVCEELDGAALVIGTCRGNTTDAPTREIFHQQFEKSMIEVCDYAKAHNVPVILELIDYTESDCCNKLPELLDYLKRLDKSNLSMYLDIMHIYNEKDDVVKIFREYGHMVPQVDISGEDRLDPMSCTVDIPAAMNALKEAGFDGVMNFEVDNKGDEELTKKSMEYIRSFFE